MNEPDESLPDGLLHELLKPLREVTAPAAVQMSNRSAVQQALSKQTQQPWWRQSISVPIPLAIAATIAIVVTTVTSLRPSPAKPIAEIESPRPDSAPDAIARPGANPVADDSIRPAWRVTQSYIRSLQALAGAHGFVEPNAKENRNDS